MQTIPYSKFKHGQRVTCEIAGEKTQDAKVSINDNGSVYLCQCIYDGLDAEDKLGYENSCYLTGKEEDYENEYKISFLDRTLDDLEKGDVLVSGYGEYKVLGVCGEVYFLSCINEFERFSSAHTIHEIKCNKKFTIKQEELEEEITELTLEDVAKLANVSVEKLRIKD